MAVQYTQALPTISLNLVRLTPKGEQFLEAEPALQVWFLLETLWLHPNWLIAYPVSGMGDHFPYRFTLTTLDPLLALPTGQPIRY